MLRMTLSAAMVIDGAERVWLERHIGMSGTVEGIVGAISIVVGVLIAVGFRFAPTIVIAVLANSEIIANVVSSSTSSGAALTAASIYIVDTAIAVSLACMGPGAYSLDAKIFGRREIIILPRKGDPGDRFQGVQR